ncbi:XdhC family protein [Flavobacterium sp.]|uniref:XdhC family protein n=1 Tax=Flavobacterium sp. TaxID=239 RepID=UPI00120DB9B1|nr:XdhC/CoxI family protein [Flavobacterium sp.]RZJ73035.1 MAG: XdhC/CoxI family protein [Flavobacterium sp.]
MKETRDILFAYEQAAKLGLKTALATVVKVDGSSYRQPGARMLVTEEGTLTGAISGGCLEGDALRKALVCMNNNHNKLVTYDTSRDEDVEFGVQLGCNGIIHILFESIDETDQENPIAILRKSVGERRESAVVTLFSETDKSSQIGTVFMAFADGTRFGQNLPSDLPAAVSAVFGSRKTSVITFENGNSALICYNPRSVNLVIAGAGNDVIPVVKAANLIGWETTVADGRATHAKARRFPEAGCVWIGNPKSVVENIAIDDQTYFVLMAHNYQYELELLKLLLDYDEIPYIGILGPRTKFEKLMADLSDARIFVSEEKRRMLFGPIGLDIGAETSEEIAISIVSEIKAVISRRNGGSLKFRNEKIHSEKPQKI